MLQVSTPKRQREFSHGTVVRSPKRLCFESCSQEASTPISLANFTLTEQADSLHPLRQTNTQSPFSSPFKKRQFDLSPRQEIFPEQPRKRIKTNFSDPQEPEDRVGFHTDFTAFAISDDQLVSWLPKHLRGKFQTNPKDAKIFSAQDLRQILANAIEETKRIVKADYDNALQARLAEQQQNFARYNEDCLDRHHRNTPVSMDYIS